jgi:hypothetical protein
MTLALLLGGLALTLAAVFMVAQRTSAVVEPVLAGETTLVGLSDPTADTLAGPIVTPAPRRTDWQLTTVNTLSDAEELLDSLESHGYADRELVVMGNSCFAVRWR